MLLVFYYLPFQTNLDPGVLKTFLYAVKNHYWYQMYLDDLPIWGIVGEIDEKGEDFYIWTHKKFEIGWNGDQIVDVNLTRQENDEEKEKIKRKIKISPAREGPSCTSPLRNWSSLMRLVQL